MSVGQIGSQECDFIARKGNDYFCIQVAMSIADRGAEELDTPLLQGEGRDAVGRVASYGDTTGLQDSLSVHDYMAEYAGLVIVVR